MRYFGILVKDICKKSDFRDFMFAFDISYV